MAVLFVLGNRNYMQTLTRSTIASTVKAIVGDTRCEINFKPSDKMS